MPTDKTSAVVTQDAGAPADAPVAPTAPTPLGEALEGWMRTALAGGPVARDTETWNAVWAALPALEQIISGLRA